MEWGLLGGLGQGLSQAAGTINRGMAEDRAAERARELEQKRAASVERRWQASEARANRQEQAQATRWAKQDERQASQDARQRERDAVSDSQFDQRMSAQEAQSIERNLSGIISEKQKAESDIVERYRKQAVDPLGQPLQGEAMEQLQSAMQNELQQVRSRYSKTLENSVQSYGDKLRGTGFAYLLDVAKPEAQASTTQQSTNKPKDPRNDLALKLITGEVKDLETGQPVMAAGTPADKSTLDKLIGGGNGELADPSFASGFARGLGGVYKNGVRPVDYKDMSPLDFAATSTGETIGYGFGLMGDAGQYVNDNAIQPAWNYLTQKPSQR